MITCLAIGATIIALFFTLAFIGSLIQVAELVAGIEADVRLHEWLAVVAFASLSCGTAVWLWHKAFAS